MKFPKIPRPLLIVIVIIVILGVVSCGAGVFRGIDEEDKPPPGNAAEAAGIGLDPGPVPANDVRATGGNCSKADRDDDGIADDIQITSFCDITIEGQILLPRVLRLSVANNSSSVIAVQQEIDGRLQPDPPENDQPEGGVVEISASGAGPVKIRILCGTCLLRIIDG